MRRIFPITIILIGFLFCLISGSGPQVASASSQSFSLTDNKDLGRIYLENSQIKLVWHYKAIASDNFNQGGGNLYEFYLKDSDPSETRNLISYSASGSWGNGSSTSLWAGIGGVGSTDLYATDVAPVQGQVNNYADLISDNNLSGTLQSYDATIDTQGNAEINFTYNVRNQQTGEEWYRVTKNWLVEQNGIIHYGIQWQILKSGYFSEIAMRSKWSHDYGWTRFGKYGKDWLPSSSQKYLLGSDGIDHQTSQCWSSLNSFQPDWIYLAGDQTVSKLFMVADNGGQGFTGSGSYQLGLSLFGTPASSTMEQCSIKPTNEIGSYSMNWMAWWGGSPPDGSRYKWIDAGRTWSDSYIIQMSYPVVAGPDISNVNVSNIQDNSAVVAWNTDLPSDSEVQIMDATGAWITKTASSVDENVHQQSISNLMPGMTYQYRIISTSNDGEKAVSGGYSITTAGSSAQALQIRLNATSWASLSDYLSRQLTASYMVTNSSGANFDSVQIDRSGGSNGVRLLSPEPITFGQVGPDSNTTFEIRYVVPAGVTVFNAFFHGTAVGPDGSTVEFPS